MGLRVVSGQIRDALHAEANALLAYFERRVEPREDAADLLAETMLQAWRRERSLPEDTVEARMWLFGIARNVLANHRRGQTRRTALMDKLRRHLRDPVAPSEEEAIAVRDAVARLDPKQGELIRLVHWDGFSLAEAASILAVNPSTARGRYATGKAELRSTLGVTDSEQVGLP